MRAPELLAGIRLVAVPAALDALEPWPAGAVRLRLAPDELFVLTGGARVHAIPDPGISEDERGFVGWWLTRQELAEVLHHVEWPVPVEWPALAQGLVAGVPAKLWLDRDRALLLCAVAYAEDLRVRLP